MENNSSSSDMLSIQVSAVDSPKSMEVEVSPKSEYKSVNLSEYSGSPTNSARSPTNSARSTKSSQSINDIPFDKNKLDFEQRAILEEKMEQLKEEHSKYIRDHVVLKQILHDFLQSILLHQPEDVFKFSREYFGKVNLKEKDQIVIRRCIVISGADYETIERLLKDFPQDTQRLILHTSRTPEPDEKQGVRYFFVSKEEFQTMVEQKQFLSVYKYMGSDYGISFQQIEHIQKTGKSCILNLDSKALEYANTATKPKPLSILLKTPANVLATKLKSRNIPEEEINEIIEQTKENLSKKDIYDIQIEYEEDQEKMYKQLFSAVLKEIASYL